MFNSRARRSLLLAASTLLALAAAPARAVLPGDFDTTFGGGAEVVFFDLVGGGDDEARAVAVFPDGSVALVGHAIAGSANSDRDLAIAKIGNNGVLVPGWGTGDNGKSVFSLDTVEDVEFEYAASAAVGAGGELLVGGSRSTGSYPDTLVARLTATGDPDNSFAGDGRSLFSTGDLVVGVGIDSAGRPVIATTLEGSGSDGYALRLKATSTADDAEALDTTYASSGIATVAVDSLRRALLLPDDRFLMATEGSSGDPFLVRLLANGSPDTTFGGGDGVAPAALSATNDSTFIDLALDPRGRYVALGSYRVGLDEFWVLARFEPDGDFDATFGSQGIAPLANEADPGYLFAPKALAVQSDGRIVVVGDRDGVSRVARYDESGALDPTFGVRFFNYGSPGENSAANAVAIGPDGKIVVAGFFSFLDSQDDRDFGVARFLSEVVFCDGFESEAIYGVSRWSSTAP